MHPADIAKLQRAVDSLNELNIEPFVGLMADDMNWRGARTGSRRWRRRPT